MSNIDPSFWTVRPKFGRAGGPFEVTLTEVGRARAWSVGAQVRPGAPARALEDDVEQLDHVVELAAPAPPAERRCDDCGRRLPVGAFTGDHGFSYCGACVTPSARVLEIMARRDAPPPSRWRPRDEDSHQRAPRGDQLMQCLSLSQPWAWCVVHGPKRVENRSTASIAGVARSLIGQRIALQAAKSYDDRGADHIRDTGLVVPMRVELDLVAGKVIGVATITHVFQCTDSYRGTFVGYEPPADQLVWAFGPWCFMLADVRAIARPVLQRGFPGFFPLPYDVERKVVEQLEVTEP